MVSSCLSFSFLFLGGEGRDIMSTCFSQKNQCLLCTYTWYLVFPFFFFFFFWRPPRGGVCEEREREARYALYFFLEFLLLDGMSHEVELFEN